MYENTQEDVEAILSSTADEPLPRDQLLSNRAHETWFRQLEIAATPRTSSSERVPEQQPLGDTTEASTTRAGLLPDNHFPGIAETRLPAAEPPMPVVNINLSRSDAPPPQHLSIPESDGPVDNVLLNHVNFLYILKPVLL
jgi:hypothetical protein